MASSSVPENFIMPSRLTPSPPPKSRKSSASSSYSSASGSLLSHPPHHHLPSTRNQMLHSFYSDRSVFITGGTGFVGKVLIEKLLYQFRDIAKVYILLRPKAGQLIRKRMQDLISSPAFERIRAHCPEQFDKITPISGDIAYAGLGINPLELQEVANNVSVIFHSAATIRFDEPLKYALKLNTMGTKRVIELAKKLKNLAAFVHVSTAYCTVQKHDIGEKVYREPISPENVLEMADWMDDETFNDKLKDIFYQGRPCSYHYTKSLAEHLISLEVERGYIPAYSGNSRPDSGSGCGSDSSLANSDVDDDSGTNQEDDSHRNEEVLPPVAQDSVDGSATWRPFPAAIIRPSIITAAWKEPFPGWIDNYNGTTGWLVVNGKGILRTMHVNPDFITDIVPVDVVINTCIAAGWYVAVCAPKIPPRMLRRNSGSSSSGLSSAGTSDRGGANVDGPEVFVVNCVSGSTNPITWAQLRDISTPMTMKHPSIELFRVPGVNFHRTQVMHQLNILLEHTIPQVVVDFMFRFMGQTPIMDQVYQKVHRTINALEHFTMNEWTYRSENLLLLDRAVRQSFIKYTYQQQQLRKDSLTTHAHHQTDLYELPEDPSSPAFSYYQVNGLKSSDKLSRHLVDSPLPMDMGELDWEQYFEDYILGIRKYLLKEKPETIPDARKTLFVLKAITLLSKVTVGGTLAYQLLYPRSMTRQCFELIRTYLNRDRSPN